MGFWGEQGRLGYPEKGQELLKAQLDKRCEAGYKKYSILFHPSDRGSNPLRGIK